MIVLTSCFVEEMNGVDDAAIVRANEIVRDRIAAGVAVEVIVRTSCLAELATGETIALKVRAIAAVRDSEATGVVDAVNERAEKAERTSEPIVFDSAAMVRTRDLLAVTTGVVLIVIVRAALRSITEAGEVSALIARVSERMTTGCGVVANEIDRTSCLIEDTTGVVDAARLRK